MLYYRNIFFVFLWMNYHELYCSQCEFENISTKDCISNTRKSSLNINHENDKIYLKLPPITTGKKEENEKYYDDSNIENDPREKFFFVETSQRDHLRMYFSIMLLNIIRQKTYPDGIFMWIPNIH